MLKHLLCILAVAHLTAAFAEEAPDAAVKEAQAVVEQYMAHAKAGEWEKSSELMHPVALSDFKEMLMAAAEGAEKKGQAAGLLSLFDGVKDIAALKGLSPKIFFTKFITTVVNKNPQVAGILAGAETSLIGPVKEGNDQIHFVYRMKGMVEEAKFSAMEVVSLKQHEAKWYVLMKANIEGMAAMLKKQFGEAGK